MEIDLQDYYWMQKTIALAKEAEVQGEVPVGAVLVKNQQVIGQGYNCPIQQCDPTAHAEIQALRQAGQKQKNYRLVHTTLYVSLEPCLMCLGALVHARVERLIFGAYDLKAGAISNGSLHTASFQNHQLSVKGGILAEECGSLLTLFFRMRRKSASQQSA